MAERREKSRDSQTVPDVLNYSRKSLRIFLLYHYSFQSPTPALQSQTVLHSIGSFQWTETRIEIFSKRCHRHPQPPRLIQLCAAAASQPPPQRRHPRFAPRPPTASPPSCPRHPASALSPSRHPRRARPRPCSTGRQRGGGGALRRGGPAHPHPRLRCSSQSQITAPAPRQPAVQSESRERRLVAWLASLARRVCPHPPPPLHPAPA